MNVPNTLTVVRLILVPVFVITMFAPLPQSWRWLPLAIIVLSGITDVADGYIARRFNQITQLGKVLDPLADKLSLLALSICIAIKFFPFWVIAVVVIIKEILQILGGGYLMKKKIKIPSSRWFGKACTAVTYCCYIILLALPIFHLIPPLWVLWTMVAVILALMLLAFFSYLPVFLRLLQQNKPLEESVQEKP
ncbi:MAG TPA: CDP-alcohol phosphatidyltransferase family protein [Candidatus Egerieicola faecale]|uniref:CDP-diacylglycerol--glycerol-3-phosphate 3-phosphatidyltransferase n=1 Tax=Candidatus Egerieicola faecale TaxID=2840774 RepID=A0A9D1LJG1_9FIRM|nr:CDP-alcohol phosphatidyltransferase family protein [Candidatus Egerieicola faecale]